MANVCIKCDRITDIQQAGWRVSGLEMDVEMSSDQMKDALAKFLENITETQWAAWLKEFASEALEEAYEHGRSAGAAENLTGATS